MADVGANNQSKFDIVRMEHYYQDCRQHISATSDFATLGLRSLFLVNGGAMIALLTFFGNVGGADAAQAQLRNAFWLFGSGVFSALIATFAAYFAQAINALTANYYADMMYFANVGSHDTAAAERGEGDQQLRRGQIARWIAILFAVLSGFAFPAGMLAALESLIG